MLEQPALLVRPLDRSRVQAIVEPCGGAPLGFARWRRRGLGFWGRWFGPIVEVHEQLDESLLFTLHRPWGLLGGREVRDADGRRVGELRGRVLWDRLGCGLAVLQREAHHGGQAFRAADGRVLARLQSEEGGLRVTFTAEVEGDPFAKMLVLAAALG